MIFTQIRHAKLWLAGNAGNWELADYEIDELKEVLENAAKHVPDYKGIPVGKMIESVALAPIEDVEKAIKAKDRARFTTAYDQLTAACNTCHKSGTGPSLSSSGRRHQFSRISHLPRDATSAVHSTILKICACGTLRCPATSVRRSLSRGKQTSRRNRQNAEMPIRDMMTASAGGYFFPESDWRLPRAYSINRCANGLNVRFLSVMRSNSRRHGMFDRQFPDRGVLARSGHDAGSDNGQKGAGRCQGRFAVCASTIKLAVAHRRSGYAGPEGRWSGQRVGSPLVALQLPRRSD